MKSKSVGSVLKIAVCSAIAVFMLVPVVLLISSSLKPPDQVMNLGLFNSPLTIESYVTVMKEDTFVQYMKNSFNISPPY